MIWKYLPKGKDLSLFIAVNIILRQQKLIWMCIKILSPASPIPGTMYPLSFK